MATVTLTLSDEAAAELNRLAAESHVQPSELVNRWLLPDQELREEDFTPEQWAMILEGEAQANAGIFASPEEVAALLNKYRNVA